MYDTTIPEDSHPQAAFMKICKHLDLLRDYQCEVPTTLQFLLVLVKFLWYMVVFTQILNMSTSTKTTPSSVKGKEKETPFQPLLILSKWCLLLGNSTSWRRRSCMTMHTKSAPSSTTLGIPSSSSNSSNLHSSSSKSSSSRGEIGHCSSSKEASRRRRPTVASALSLAKLNKMLDNSVVPTHTPMILPPPLLPLPPLFLMTLSLFLLAQLLTCTFHACHQ